MSQLVDFYEIWWAVDVIEWDIDEIIFKSPNFNHFKMAEVQSSEMDALSAPFSIAQQWVGFV
jgi:hypothetical protein